MKVILKNPQLGTANVGSFTVIKIDRDGKVYGDGRLIIIYKETTNEWQVVGSPALFHEIEIK